MSRLSCAADQSSSVVPDPQPVDPEQFVPARTLTAANGFVEAWQWDCCFRVCQVTQLTGLRDGPDYVDIAFSVSLSLSETLCFRLSRIDASVFTELAALSSFSMASSLGLSAAATVCCTSIRA
jgi:hypothetical protein